MGARPGRVALLEQLRADGVTVMFGNPGTSEEGFLDAMRTFGSPEYVLTLQESIAVAMADGYARSSGRVGLVQLHSGVGLGNGIGMIYQALRGHAPLLILAGDSGVRYDAMDAQMATDLVKMAQPVTKYAIRVTDPRSVLRVLRRAIKMALTPPTGPVFVALPLDVLDAPNEEAVVRTVVPSTRSAPDAAELEPAVRALVAASSPVVLMGDGIARSEAQAELAVVAEALGARVWGVDSSEVNLPASHPLFAGLTGHMFGDESRRRLEGADAVLVCGTYLFPEVFPCLSGVFPGGVKTVHIDLDGYEIAKNFPVDFAFVSDPKRTLARLAEVIERVSTPQQKQAARHRVERISDERRAASSAGTDGRADPPSVLTEFAAALSRRVGEDAIVFDEALTCSPDLRRGGRADRPGSYYQTRGGSLGVGFPGAMGMKLAHPERPVIGFSGDGGSMYTIQSLWTAAHHRIGAKLVVCNNGTYALLKSNLEEYRRERGLAAEAFPAFFDLGQPSLRFDLLARSMGVPAVRVERRDQSDAAIDQMLSSEGPFLVDLVLPGAGA